MRFIFLTALCAAILLSSGVQAGDPPPFPEFTFKKGKPPKAGARVKLVQIDPEEQAKALTPTKDESAAMPAVPTAKAAYAWFWTKVPAGQGEDGARRLALAFETLRNGPGGARVAGPRLQAVQSIAQARGAEILRATIGTDVSPALVLAVIAVESSGRTDAVSHAGAQGLMQLMPATADRFGVTDSLSPAQNIKGGVAYLDWLLNEFGGDAVLALAGYNAGENAVKKHAGVPPFAETRDYIPKVLAAFEVASGLCHTRPELITDACALRLASN
ncbi:lytic transglycosylase domain-containing protein [Roseovarius aestuariivivens]|uniref:lytic transglycosylase domain-containing protein n=1 Tax=Roseovarius aestuariivivens TaxID=1888910 RepID=UPI001080CD9E|nr:transglycosylase SLT domain-containing protein [Roseovarius aestuariivivens]